MELSVNAKIFYPCHGAGWVKGVREIEFNGEVRAYYEISFIDNPMTVSTPQSNINNLGIRPVSPSKAIISAIEKLKKSPSLKPEISDYNSFLNLVKNLDQSGNVEDFVKIIQYCNWIREQRLDEKRIIPSSITKYTKQSLSYLITELAISENIDLDVASERFFAITGIDSELFAKE